MQLHIRGQQTHVLEVLPSETIETVKVSVYQRENQLPADIHLLTKPPLVVITKTSAR